MKTFSTVILAIAIVFMAATGSFAYPATVTLDSKADSGGDYFNGISMLFNAGVYEFSVLDGAWNVWGTVDLPDKGWMWSFDIYQEDSGAHFRLGNKTDKYADASGALNAHKGESLTITQPSDGYLWFYLKDGKPGEGEKLIADNIGTVTASVNLVHAPEPVSSVLIIAGGATLGLRHLLKRKRRTRNK